MTGIIIGAAVAVILLLNRWDRRNHEKFNRMFDSSDEEEK